jgi:hypothetical protein
MVDTTKVGFLKSGFIAQHQLLFATIFYLNRPTAVYHSKMDKYVCGEIDCPEACVHKTSGY